MSGPNKSLNARGEVVDTRKYARPKPSAPDHVMQKSSAQAVTGTLSAMGLSKASKIMGTVGDIVITPVVWVASGARVDAADVGLYALGFTPVGLAAAGTSIIKGFVDDHNDSLLAEVRADYPPQFRKFIRKTSDSGWFASDNWNTAAKLVARYGATAWQHKNGLCVYAEDAEGKYICNFKVKAGSYKRWGQPKWQPRKDGFGGYLCNWHL